MGNAGRKADGLSSLSEFVPMGDDIPDQIIAVHALGELAFDIITSLNLHAFQVWDSGCIDDGSNQIFLFDEFRDLMTLN
jgi:hypothetical protein